MIHIRHADERGKTALNWLDGKHTFSFGHYHDQEHMSFRSLRVMNEDVIAAAGGFGTHPHKNMEIITYVIDGQLDHKDSEGNVGTIEHGEIQCMSAGSGIQHSEYNPSSTDSTHLYQIWLTPDKMNIKPGYQQKHIPIHEQKNQLHLIASPHQGDGSLDINQDAKLYAGEFDAGTSQDIAIETKRHAWIQVVAGEIQISDSSDTDNNYTLSAGDGLAVSDTLGLRIEGTTEYEILVFDLA